jgi:hypothetical protein
LLLQGGGACFGDLQIDFRLARAQSGDQGDRLRRRERTHQAEAQRRGPGAHEVPRLVPRVLHLAVGLREERLHPLAEGREMGVGAAAVKQRAAELGLQQLDGARERGLGDGTTVGRTREVQLLAERKKIADLMQFHGGASLAASDRVPLRLRNAEVLSFR